MEGPRLALPEPYPQMEPMKEIKYNELNLQLKKKLLEFKKCNDSNVAKAKQEIGKLAAQSQEVKNCKE